MKHFLTDIALFLTLFKIVFSVEWYSTLHSHIFNLKTDKLNAIITVASYLTQRSINNSAELLMHCFIKQIGYNKANNTGTDSNGRKGPIYF